MRKTSDEPYSPLAPRRKNTEEKHQQMGLVPKLPPTGASSTTIFVKTTSELPVVRSTELSPIVMTKI
jgi:hypothetical protein